MQNMSRPLSAAAARNLYLESRAFEDPLPEATEIAYDAIRVPFPPQVTAEELVPEARRRREHTKSPNAFMIYRQQYLKQLHARGHFLKMTEVSSLASRSWKAQPYDVQRAYKEIALNAASLVNEVQRYTACLLDKNWRAYKKGHLVAKAPSRRQQLQKRQQQQQQKHQQERQQREQEHERQQQKHQQEQQQQQQQQRDAPECAYLTPVQSPVESTSVSEFPLASPPLAYAPPPEDCEQNCHREDASSWSFPMIVPASAGAALSLLDSLDVQAAVTTVHNAAPCCFDNENFDGGFFDVSTQHPESLQLLPPSPQPREELCQQEQQQQQQHQQHQQYQQQPVMWWSI